MSLGLEPGYFRDPVYGGSAHPVCTFHYPPVTPKSEEDDQMACRWHTDYGVLTILKQDDVGGSRSSAVAVD